jgi:phosphoglycerol transferase
MNDQRKKSIIDVSIAMGVGLLIAGLLMNLGHADWNIPFQYFQRQSRPFPWLDFDGNLYLAMAKNVVETGWISLFPRLGAPLPLSGTDYPQFYFELGLVGFVRVLTSLGFSWAQAVNIFYVAGYPIIAAIGVLSFRAIGAGRVGSIVAAIIFAFLPCRYMTGQMHMAMAFYYAIPPACFIALRIAERKPWTRKDILIAFLVSVLLASNDMYYAVFGAFLSLFGGIIAYLNADKNRVRAFIPGLLHAATTALILAICISPALVAQATGASPGVHSLRDWTQAEFFGLKMTEMFLPVRGHFISIFDKAAQRHFVYPWTHVNEAAAFGLAGTIGFIILMARIIRGNRISNPTEEKERLAGIFVLCMILYATVGGFGALFAYVIAPYLRSLYHISPFIAFFCLLPVANSIDKVQVKNPRMLALSIAAIFCLLAVADESGKLIRPRYKEVTAAWSADKTFFDSVEAKMPTGSAVLQIPYALFPEGEPPGAATMYEALVPYFHTTTLRWSYGIHSARPQAEKTKDIASEPASQIPADACAMGWNAVLIDRMGFEHDPLRPRPEDVEEAMRNRDAELETYFKSFNSVQSADQRYLFAVLPCGSKAAQ